MVKATKVIKAIIMTLIVVAGVCCISEAIITVLIVCKTLLSGGVPNVYTDMAKNFMEQSAIAKMLLLLLAELMIPGLLIGVGGFIVMISRKIKEDAPEEYEENAEDTENI